MARIVAKLLGGPEDGTFWSVDESQTVIYGLNNMVVELDSDGNPILESDGFPRDRYTKRGDVRPFTAEQLDQQLNFNNELGVCEFTYDY